MDGRVCVSHFCGPDPHKGGHYICHRLGEIRCSDPPCGGQAHPPALSAKKLHTHKGRPPGSPYILTHTAHSKSCIMDAPAKTSQSLPARFHSGETLPLQLYPLPVLDVGHQQ